MAARDARQQLEELRDRDSLISTIGHDAALNRRLAALPAPTPRPGTLRARPASPAIYRLPAPATILIGTGERAPDGAGARGLTLAIAPGAAIAAPAAGRIAYAGHYRGYGAILIIAHGHGWTTLLAGLDSLAVAAGEEVAMGRPLGHMPARRPRLTVELRHDGRVADVAAVAAWRGG